MAPRVDRCRKAFRKCSNACAIPLATSRRLYGRRERLWESNNKGSHHQSARVASSAKKNWDSRIVRPNTVHPGSLCWYALSHLLFTEYLERIHYAVDGLGIPLLFLCNSDDHVQAIPYQDHARIH